MPSWTGQTCPEHSTCTLDATPDCTCADACPVAAWKRLPQVVGSHLVKWETVTAVTDSVRTAGAANNVSFVIQPDRHIPAGSLITVAGLTGAMTADRSADAGCAITGRCFVQVLFIDNLLVRIHFIIVMIRWTDLAPWEFGFLFPGQHYNANLPVRSEIDWS